MCLRCPYSIFERTTAFSNFSLGILFSCPFLSIHCPPPIPISMDKVPRSEGHSSSINKQSWLHLRWHGSAWIAWMTASVEDDGATEILNHSQFPYFPIHHASAFHRLEMSHRLECRVKMVRTKAMEKTLTLQVTLLSKRQGGEAPSLTNGFFPSSSLICCYGK